MPALALLAACASSLPAVHVDRSASAPLGSLLVCGPTFGHETLLPTACVAGERQLFLGFDLRDEKAGVVTRLIVDPASGPLLRVYAAATPLDRSVLFRRADCRVLNFSLDSTGWRIDRIGQLDVSLEVDCQLPSGESIIGKAADPGCL